MLNRQDYLQRITDTFALLETSFRNRILINLYDSNIIAEDFFEGLLNIMYDLKLKNINKIKKNAASVDLVDETNKKAYQVTSTNTHQKIQKTINSFIKHKLKYKFDDLYIILLKSKLSTYGAFQNASQVNFDNKNILDFKDLILHANTLATKKLEEICSYLTTEVKNYKELNSLNFQTDKDAKKNYKSLINRKALLDTFHLEGSMHEFADALIEINQAFSIGLIKQGLETKPIHRISDDHTRDELESIQYKIIELHRLYRMYVKTGEIDPNSNAFFPKNSKNTTSVFNNFRQDIVNDFNRILNNYSFSEIKLDYDKYPHP